MDVFNLQMHELPNGRWAVDFNLNIIPDAFTDAAASKGWNDRPSILWYDRETQVSIRSHYGSTHQLYPRVIYINVMGRDGYGRRTYASRSGARVLFKRLADTLAHFKQSDVYQKYFIPKITGTDEALAFWS